MSSGLENFRYFLGSQLPDWWNWTDHSKITIKWIDVLQFTYRI